MLLIETSALYRYVVRIRVADEAQQGCSLLVAVKRSTRQSTNYATRHESILVRLFPFFRFLASAWQACAV